MTVQEALQNIDIVVSNVPMKRIEHWQLQQDLKFITQRCERADELEKQIKEETELDKEVEKEKDKPNV
ncbi:unnamed protein product [marine sediment metagenome]|uniref:Uncharacterized protein n=1 Tax=marine sediment metagenome TaxID=412755 RepID=X0YXZ4_9ZZZZ